MDAETPLKILENVPLAPFTTLGVGGPARFFVRAEKPAGVKEALDHAADRGLKVFILGGGSNVLVSDAGFDGLVIHLALKGVENADPIVHGADGDPSVVRITAMAGENWDEFVETCVGKGLAGLECLSGIPGYVGGTPVQNVGAYGQEVSETISRVECLDRHTGSYLSLSNEDCGFAYRKSIFNSVARDRYVVLSVTFSLKAGGAPKIVYKDLLEFFDGRSADLAQVREAVLRIRAAKSMVIDAADPNCRSAGSFFKNPVVPRQKIDEIRVIVGNNGVPHFEAGDDRVKIPAAWLIEQAGFHKGFALGNAGISTNHSLALINRGGAAAAEIVELKDKIAGAVNEKFGLELVPEPVFVGF